MSVRVANLNASFEASFDLFPFNLGTINEMYAYSRYDDISEGFLIE